MSSKPILLILGAGSNIGHSLATHFAAAGFLVASVSRSKPSSVSADGEQVHIQADLSDAACIPGIFSQVQSRWGPPSVVVYNAASRTVLPPSDPLSTSPSSSTSFSPTQVTHDLTVNITSALLAAHHSILGFRALPPPSPSSPALPQKTFIYTGNALPSLSKPDVLYFGMCKSAAAHMIWDLGVAYGGEGFRFYYPDQRTPSGESVMTGISGAASAEFYLRLVRGEEEQGKGKWWATFVDYGRGKKREGEGEGEGEGGVRYVDFGGR